MNKNVEMAAHACARRVQQASAGGFQSRRRGVDIGHAQRHMVQAGTALADELFYGGIGLGRFSSSMRASPAGSMATWTFSAPTLSRCATANPMDW